MKILYLLNESIGPDSGIVHKIYAQTQLWKQSGHIVKIVTLSSDAINSSLSGYTVLQKRKSNESAFEKFIRNYKGYKLLHSILLDFKPDVIYTRAQIFSPNMMWTLRQYPYLIELNSLDVIESKQWGKAAKLYHAVTRSFFYRYAKGFIAVSHEINNHTSFSKYKKPSIVISNGYNITIDACGYEQHKKYTDKPHAVFIGTGNNNWHGVDKILKLADVTPKIHFHMIGEMHTEAKSNVTFHGKCSKEVADQILKKCHVGISTMALHYKDMKEASPLKSRHYLSLGLPIIAAYIDTDFDGSEEYILHLPNHEQNVAEHADKIVQFCDKAFAGEIMVDLKDVKCKTSWAVKEKERLSFIKKLASSQ